MFVGDASFPWAFPSVTAGQMRIGRACLRSWVACSVPRIEVILRVLMWRCSVGAPSRHGGAYNHPMDYQLVIKFWRKSLANEAFLTLIEDRLKEVLDDAIELEGYDVSPKEINLFMIASDPRHSFRRVKEVLEGLGVINGVSAAFRLVGGTRFTSIWPLRTTRKFKLP